MTMFDLSDSEDEDEELTPEEIPLDIRVVLDREVYFVGQEITGVILINNPVKRRMRGIRLTLRCRAEVVWWHSKSGPFRKSSNIKYLNDDNLLYTEKYVVGDGKAIFLQAGKQQFPFSILLKGKKKRQLPSSMEFPNGNIRYYLKAELDWPWASAQDHERIVSVVDPVNLCDVRDALQPATFTKTIKVGLGLSRKKIHIAGRLEKLGYVPGEEALLHVEIDNGSSSRISSCVIQLVEIVKYLSSDNHHVVTRNVLSITDLGPIAKNCDLVKEKEPLYVPVVAQSAVSAVEFMKITHEISIVIVVNGKMKSVSQRIIIGTLPTKNSYKRFSPGSTPPPQICMWPYGHMTRVPCPTITTTPPCPGVDWNHIMDIDPDFHLQNVCYQFERKTAIETFDDISEADSDEDEGDLQGNISDFSI